MTLIPLKIANMTFQSVSLDKHNYYRAKHDAAPLTWDRNCQVHAQNWANQLLRTNTFGHSSDRNDMGENIWAYYMTRGKLKKTDEQMAEEAIKAWYDEVKKYSYIFPGFSKKTGHFTQVVWKDTTKVGMAIAKDSEKAFVCANYAPQGNVLARSEFKKNVKRKKGACSIM
ncbi:hypothetical protein ACHWQZ_G014133 [Mnemiopsis leidyi]